MMLNRKLSRQQCRPVRTSTLIVRAVAPAQPLLNKDKKTYETVADIMKNTVLYTCAPDDSVDKALELIVAHKVSGLPVVNQEGQVVGVVSDFDLLALFSQGRTNAGPLFPKTEDTWQAFREVKTILAKGTGKKVRDVMTCKPLTVKSTAHIDEATSLLLQKRIRRLPVVDDNGVLVGLVSRSGIVQAALELRKTSDAKQHDDLMRVPGITSKEIEVHGWQITTRKGPIISDKDTDAFRREPLSLSNRVTLLHRASGLALDFTALEGLRAWLAEDLPALQVKLAKEWQAARQQEITQQQAKQLAYDWTFTTPYSGCLTSQAAAAASIGPGDLHRGPGAATGAVQGSPAASPAAAGPSATPAAAVGPSATPAAAAGPSATPAAAAGPSATPAAAAGPSATPSVTGVSATGAGQASASVPPDVPSRSQDPFACADAQKGATARIAGCNGVDATTAAGSAGSAAAPLGQGRDCNSSPGAQGISGSQLNAVGPGDLLASTPGAAVQPGAGQKLQGRAVAGGAGAGSPQLAEGASAPALPGHSCGLLTVSTVGSISVATAAAAAENAANAGLTSSLSNGALRGSGGVEEGEGEGSGPGSGPAGPGMPSWHDSLEQIDRALLMERDPILLFDEVVLYESDLDDNGVSQLSIKLRVMPRAWLLLLRFWLRVDGCMVRLRETRLFCRCETHSQRGARHRYEHVITQSLHASRACDAVRFYQKLRFKLRFKLCFKLRCYQAVAPVGVKKFHVSKLVLPNTLASMVKA
ncbi:hypothetical protein QJQ45_003673 [Haematococcus lacustris]|nr:hypothetical protein QJQ45_003673 [Haematococcus lacustris]